MKYLILGLIQGITEFLPVSSSGHLVIFTKLFGLPTDLFFDALVHVATALAVILYFRKDIWGLIKGFILGSIEVVKTRSIREIYNKDVYFRIACLILVATFATGIIGISFQDYFEGWFDSLLHVGYFLLLTGGLILLAEKVGTGKKKEKEFTKMDALLIGAAQGAAIAPGLSRSGTTISMALLRDLDRNLAARFSFILSAIYSDSACIVETGFTPLEVTKMLLSTMKRFGTSWLRPHSLTTEFLGSVPIRAVPIKCHPVFRTGPKARFFDEPAAVMTSLPLVRPCARIFLLFSLIV